MMQSRHSRSRSAESSPRTLPPAAGRPVSGARRNVPEDIVQAAETCLSSKSPREIHVKEIAELAGVQTAMIHYYFGNKDGLLVELVRRGLDKAQNDFRTLSEAIRRNELSNPTRAMIAQFVVSYKRYPAVGTILGSEVLLENSAVRNFFIEHWHAHGKTMIAEAIRQLSASGYYRKDVNIDDISTMIRSAIFFPLLMRPSLLPGDRDPAEHYLGDDWIDFVASVFDRYLRP